MSSTERLWQLQIIFLTKQAVDSDKNKQAKSVLTLGVHTDAQANVARHTDTHSMLKVNTHLHARTLSATQPDKERGHKRRAERAVMYVAA